ncbi:sodium-dependent glucose transporter 1-like [Galendromus occidentalis]|uniref:Sodium-dependent glucose transporter 1-like n=1 Tax=Galendromus occidentalis TaxID=34638 RepID=A0AAJ7PAC6_9ACAR|nr:sodium-dependent glucose transporter 1-like [Galendromus occidentalis]
MGWRAKTKMEWWHSYNQLMIMFGVGIGFGVFGPSMMDLADMHSTTTEEVALMNSARAFGMFIGSCFGGYFYEFMNDQILTLIFSTVYGVGTIAIPLLPSPTYLHIFGFVAGLSFGIAHIGSQVRLVKIWSDQSASAIQAFHTACGLGSMVGPFVVAPFLSARHDGVLVKEAELKTPYLLFGVLYFLMFSSMLGAYFCDPSTIKKMSVGGNEEAKPKMKKSTELFIMALLFVYLALCVNTEHTFGSIMILFKRSDTCVWVGSSLMGVGVSSMYGAACGLIFEYIRIRHSYVGTVLAASCLGLAISAYAVPPFIERWPMFFQYFLGFSNILNIVFLLMIFAAIRSREKIIADKDEPSDRKNHTDIPV